MADEAEAQGRDSPVRRDRGVARHLEWVIPSDGPRNCCLCGVVILKAYILVTYNVRKRQSHAACSKTCAVALDLGAPAHRNERIVDNTNVALV